MPKSLPTYDLYGERAGNGADFWLHCETIPSRSSLHHWEIGLHRHDSFFQILYISGGSGDAVFGTKTIAITPRAVITVPPAVAHGFRFSKDIDGFVFTVLVSHLRVAPGAASRFGTFLAEPRVTPLTPGNRDAAYAAETLERLGAEWLRRRSGRTDLMEAYLASALTLTARLSDNDPADAGTAGNDNERRIERLTALVHQHFRSQRPASFYAEALGISPTHLNRIVKSVTGQTAHAFIGRKLLEEAKRELVFTRTSAQEIGLRLGFADPAYFSRFFLQKTGMTPRAWRITERARLDTQSSD